MSRLDGKFTAAGEAPLDAAEILAALEAQAADSKSDRQDAIARYLAAGEGWREALQQLGGAFAEPARAEPLKSRKDR